jgi:NTP pyrophosphatase (non-canonical NTP hydrolase)
MAEDNISNMEKLESLSTEISYEIKRAKHSVILRKSLIEEAEKRLNQYINHVNTF